MKKTSSNMKHYFFKHILLCLALLAGTNALAYDAYIDGIYYKFSGDEAEVTYQIYDGYYYSDYSGAVVIPSSVTYNATTYSVTSIGSHAFIGCYGLTSITIPNSVTCIGDEAFLDCYSLSSVTIPSNVTSIGNSAFSGCYFVSSSFVNNSLLVSDYNWGATLYFNAIETSEGLIIKDSIVVRCRRWATSVTIPNSVTSIGDYAFQYCWGLSSITIPNSLTNIGEYAFSNCSGLTSVTIPNSVTSIGSRAFYGCSGLTSITIPNSVTSIGNYTFFGCSSLTPVIIPNSVTSIGEGAFYNCSSLTSLTIPNSITSIGSSAFSGCSGLISVTIGNSVTRIGSSAFRGCKLHNILVKSVIPPYITAENSFSQNIYNHTSLFIPCGSWDDYVFNSNWYMFINIRETATTEEELSVQQAYTLMDAGTFAYSVYDPVNDCIGTISSVSDINEDNPNHSWQMIEAGGNHYLYNIGAKKYVKRNGNSLDLTDTPEPIEVEDGDNGIILGAQLSKQWALVSNEHVSVAQYAIYEVTGIVSTLGETEKDAIYNLAGQHLSKPQKGLNIIGGRKVLVK